MEPKQEATCPQFSKIVSVPTGGTLLSFNALDISEYYQSAG
ncbi:hypothetical protein AB0758_49630 [Tolypothrix bouteillei VB521301_2]